QATRSESKRGRGSGERRSTLRRIFFPSFFVRFSRRGLQDLDALFDVLFTMASSRFPERPHQAQSPLSRVLPRGRPLRGEAQGENWRSRRLLWCVLACRTRLSSATTVFVGTPAMPSRGSTRRLRFASLAPLPCLLCAPRC